VTQKMVPIPMWETQKTKIPTGCLSGDLITRRGSSLLLETWASRLTWTSEILHFLTWSAHVISTLDIFTAC